MTEAGARFERGDFFSPEMLAAARAMQAGMDVLRPLLMGEGLETVGRMVIGTVKGDVHDIGKNLVRMMFEGAGFEVIDLRIDVAPEAFVEASDRRPFSPADHHVAGHGDRHRSPRSGRGT